LLKAILDASENRFSNGGWRKQNLNWKSNYFINVCWVLLSIILILKKYFSYKNI